MDTGRAEIDHAGGFTSSLRHSLVRQPQSELNEPRVIVLSRNLPKGCRAYLGVGRCELHPIEDVENFEPEKQLRPLGDWGRLGHCEIRVIDSRSPHGWIDARLVADFPRSRRGKARRVEPLRQMRLQSGGIRSGFVAAGGIVRTAHTRAGRPRAAIADRKIRLEQYSGLASWSAIGKPV